MNRSELQVGTEGCAAFSVSPRSAVAMIQRSGRSWSALALALALVLALVLRWCWRHGGRAESPAVRADWRRYTLL
jgi:hypothetical protein